jgi:hypothetical protein
MSTRQLRGGKWRDGDRGWTGGGGGDEGGGGRVRGRVWSPFKSAIFAEAHNVCIRD